MNQANDSGSRTATWMSGLLFGVLYGLPMSYFFGWLPPENAGNVAATLVLMLLSGGLFGFLMGLFLRSRFLRVTSEIEAAPGEVIEHKGLANHFLNREARGGQLALTNSHLVFKPHAINLQRSGLRVARRDIAKVEAVRTLGLIPNGMLITLKSGEQERFVVDGRQEWLSRLAA